MTSPEGACVFAKPASRRVRATTPRGDPRSRSAVSLLDSTATAVAEAKRSAGSFSRRRMTMRSRGRGTSGARARSGVAGARRMRCVEAPRVLLVLALERARPGEHLVEDDSERKEIAPRVRRVAEDLLGRHVRGRAEGAGLVGRRSASRAFRVSLGDAEVDELDLAAERHEHVARLHVAMDDPGSWACSSPRAIAAPMMAAASGGSFGRSEEPARLGPGDVLEDEAELRWSVFMSS